MASRAPATGKLGSKPRFATQSRAPPADRFAMKTRLPDPSLKSDPIYILVASGFDEGDVIACLDPLRSAGVLTVMVCPSTRRVRGEHGLSVEAGLTLEQAGALPLPRAILIPGGGASADALWADPRAHALVLAVLRAGAVVGAFGASQTPLARLAMAHNAPSFVLQGEKAAADFVSELITRLCASAPGLTRPRTPSRAPSH